MFEEATPEWAWTVLKFISCKQGLFLHFTEVFCIWPCAVFTVGAEHISEGGVEAQRDQSCSELEVFTSNKHQECRAVS